jgi:solute:Na+ symporter, SSS family
MDILVILVYLVGMVAMGWWGKNRARTESDYLVAGRRLGPVLYMGTLAALVLGGASTIGGVALGYEYGISGMWLVVAIGSGVLVLSLAFAGRISRLKVYTVSEMLELRYGPGSSVLSGVVMAAYTLMLSVTSTIAYAVIFAALLDMGKIPSILLGGGVVVLYSALGGMWSITATDFVQFVIQTVGIFLVLLPIAIWRAGGLGGMRTELGDAAFDVTSIGTPTIITYFVIYFFGLLIGQDIWQRVFTARSDTVARYAGAGAGVYCLLYGVAGAVVGMAAKVLVPNLSDPNEAFVEITEIALPVGLTGLVLAAALAAIMSTASGTLIAAATVTSHDIVGAIRGKPEVNEDGEIGSNRWWVLGFGVLVIVISCVLQDVVAALTVAYDILVGGLLVPILGGLLWRRATNAGALAAIGVGSVATLTTMAVVGDVFANEPVYFGLGSGLVVFVVVSLATRPTSPEVLAAWDRRLEGKKPATEDRPAAPTG